MKELSELEKAIYNDGERFIPGLTHSLGEWIRHYSSYLFFRQIIASDLMIQPRDDEAITIVDLGCGVGYGSRMLSAIPNSCVTGVDSSGESLGYAQEHYDGANIAYVQADLADLIPAISEYDYAVSRNVIEHIPNGLQLAKSVKWRKRLIFDVPYAELRGANPHHVLTGITEADFTGFDGIEIFYQDLSGYVYDAQHKPQSPNIMICVCSRPGLPKVSERDLGFDAFGRLSPMRYMEKQDCANSPFPLVSIVTPAYNRASCLDETIQSVLSQNYPRLEYIVLDDGSKDNTREVLEKYTGRLTWETHPNMGEQRTVSKGFSMAHGEIVAVVNSDDPLLPGALAAAVDFMQSHPDILVGYGDWNYIDPRSNVTGHVQVPEYDYLHMLRRHHCIVGPGAFIRREAFELTGGRNPEFKYVGDFEYWLRLGLYGKFARIPSTLATFRVHPDSLSVSEQGRAMASEHVRLFQKFYARADLPSEVRHVRAEALCYAHFVAAQVCGAARGLARRHYLRAFLYHPPAFLSNWNILVTFLLVTIPRPLLRPLRWAWPVVRPVLARARQLLRRLGV